MDSAGEHKPGPTRGPSFDREARGIFAIRAERAPASLDEARTGRAATTPGREGEPVPQVRRPPWWRDQLRRRALAVADLAVAWTGIGLLVAFAAVTPMVLAIAPIWLGLAKLLGLYDADHRSLRHLTLDEMPALAGWTALGVVGASLVGGALEGSLPALGSVLWIWALTWATAGLARALARGLWRRAVPRERAVVVGSGQVADSARRKLEIFRDAHIEVVGAVAAPYRGGPSTDEELQELAHGADRILVATDALEPGWLERLVVACRDEETKVSAVSPLRGRDLPAAHLSRLADDAVLEFDTWDVSRSTAVIKRAFDLALGTPLLLASLVTWPAIALAIKLDSRGPVFFRQPRAGLGGEPFTMLKFRTMREGAHQELGSVVDLDKLPEPAFKLADDPRVTRVGRMLRRLSLDELPQLVNVVRGEMSLVGPRPEMMEIVDRYRPEHRLRLAVKPGLTGPMQVAGRGELGFADRLAVEIDYVENPSLGRDLRILAQTLPAVFHGRGAW